VATHPKFLPVREEFVYGPGFNNCSRENVGAYKERERERKAIRNSISLQKEEKKTSKKGKNPKKEIN